MINNIPLVILCGGKSSRMGFPKGLIEIKPSLPLLLYNINKFHDYGGLHVYIILGFDNQKYFDEIFFLSLARTQAYTYNNINIRVLINENPEKGQFSSLKKATSVLSHQTLKGAFITPIDIPTPDKEVWVSLSKSLTPQTKVAIPTFGEKGGHPVLLSLNFIKEINEIDINSENARLDKIIQKQDKKNVVKIEVSDPQVLLNINNKEDFLNIKKKQNFDFIIGN